MAIEHIRVSERARDRLITIKRRTKIRQWNIVCRWAVCVSLAEPTTPPPADHPADSSVEMTWKVFGGEYRDVYLALLKERCRQDGLGTSEETLAEQFRLHLHRGIGYLVADQDLRSIGDLFERIPGLDEKSPS